MREKDCDWIAKYAHGFGITNYTIDEYCGIQLDNGRKVQYYCPKACGACPSASPTAPPITSSCEQGYEGENCDVQQPSESPSASPSESALPSDSPSKSPSALSAPLDIAVPSGSPSDSPSESAHPSESPSLSPSVSMFPSDTPSEMPSAPCPEDQYRKPDGTCTTTGDPCEACPLDMVCIDNTEMEKVCLDCSCGFCDQDGASCCKL